jgi:nicotinamide riboside transporter PnuC
VVIDVVIGVLVLGLLITRQLRRRRVSDAGWRIVVILGIIGVLEIVQFLKTSHQSATIYAALGGSLVLAAAFGAARAATVRVWKEEGQVWSQGNWLTAVLWVIALAAHLGYDYLIAPGHGQKDIGTSTAVLYLAVSLAIQRLIISYRASRLEPAAPSPTVGQFGGTS